MVIAETPLNIYEYARHITSMCHSISTELYEISIIIPILLMRKLRLRKIEWRADGDTAE